MARRTLFTLAVLALACSTPTAFASQRSRQAEPPPGMVRIEGGRTQIGTPLKEIEKRILEEPQAQQRGNSLLSETPRHSVKIDPFFLMVNEVTNEQYEAFVRATGHKPPENWASDDDEKAALAAFLEAENKRREGLKAEGKKVDRRSFDKEKWWNNHWAESEWAVPKGAEHQPVRYVSHTDALAYARWAGLRLMTELEYQRAVRGDTERTFPWGDEFVVDNAGTQERPERRSEPFPVGSFPGGAVGGVYDLAGNVWEWTASSYTAFPGYKPIKLTVGRGRQKREKPFTSAWDPDSRVCVGGSVQNSELAARATARRRLERVQTTDVVGFRCAASVRVGQDVAETVLERDLPRSVRPSDEKGKVEYLPELVLAFDRWEVSGEVEAEADAKDAASDDDAEPVEASDDDDGDGEPAEASATRAQTPPPGYAVIEDYDYIVFIPSKEARYSGETTLRKETVKGQPVALGVLATTYPVEDPKLDAGTYMIGFRGKGERKKPRREKPEDQGDETNESSRSQDDEDVAVEDPYAWETALGLDPGVDNFVIYDKKGNPIAVLPCDDSAWKLTRMEPGRLAVVDVEVIEGEGKEQVVRTEKRLNVEIMLQGLTSRKGFRFTLPLKLDEDVLQREWRTQ